VAPESSRSLVIYVKFKKVVEESLKAQISLKAQKPLIVFTEKLRNFYQPNNDSKAFFNFQAFIISSFIKKTSIKSFFF
jgi:hypothetical protein